MSYTYDNFGVIRLGDAIIEQKEDSAAYQTFLVWQKEGGVVEMITSPEAIVSFEKYRATQMRNLIEAGDRFVKSLTDDLLECELQTFSMLAEECKEYVTALKVEAVQNAKDADAANRAGVAYITPPSSVIPSVQIATQAEMTGKTPLQVAERSLLLKAQQTMVVPVLSAFRQNISAMLAATTTPAQVDYIVATAKEQGVLAIRSMIAKMAASEGGKG